MTSYKTRMCERSSLMRLTITFIVLSSSYVSVFNRLTHWHILSPSVISPVSDEKEFHMGIIVMIINVLMFNYKKEDRQYRIKTLYWIFKKFI
jgi:hypothetical protein